MWLFIAQGILMVKFKPTVEPPGVGPQRIIPTSLSLRRINHFR